MSETEINYLLTNNIKTIIDFRTSDEINRKPSILSNNKFNYYNISLKGHKCPKYEKDIPSNYIEIIDDKEKIKEVLMLIFFIYVSIKRTHIRYKFIYYSSHNYLFTIINGISISLSVIPA